MLKGLMTLGLGMAAVGLVRFAVSAINEERQRRSALHEDHETTRWEGEGGNLVSPHPAAGEA